MFPLNQNVVWKLRGEVGICINISEKKKDNSGLKGHSLQQK